MKDKISEFFRATGSRSRQIVVRRRFEVLLVSGVLLYLFWPKRSPQLSTDALAAEAAQAQTKYDPASTQPSTSHQSPSSNQQPASVEMLFDPAARDADPKWALPAELNSA